jgi:hypothetical protein
MTLARCNPVDALNTMPVRTHNLLTTMPVRTHNLLHPLCCGRRPGGYGSPPPPPAGQGSANEPPSSPNPLHQLAEPELPQPPLHAMAPTQQIVRLNRGDGWGRFLAYEGCCQVPRHYVTP